MGTFVVIWAVSTIALALLAVWVGIKSDHGAVGVFIDARNTWSLSQFQIAMWTLVVLPLLFGTVLWRLLEDESSAWDFTIPGELLALLGITLGSTVSALTIKASKDAARGHAIGARVPNPDQPAPFSDLFMVEEGDDSLKAVDITKLQNFAITLSLLVSYVWIVLNQYGDLPDGVAPSALPELNQNMIGLLAVSHGGYLVGKLPNRVGEPGGGQPADGSDVAEGARVGPEPGGITSRDRLKR